jgi:uncharacterized membrane protein YfcA
MEIIDLVIIFLVGAGASYFFVATGGVGLVTTPALMLMGLPPQVAIATDVFSMLGGRVGGMIGLRKAGKLDIKSGLQLSLIATIGAVIGAFTLLAIPAVLMKNLLIAFFLLMLVLLLRKPAAQHQASGDISPLRKGLGVLAFFFVGFWGTMVGAGFLSIGSGALLFIYRRSFLEAAGILTIVGLAVGLVGLVIFGVNGVINWPIGIALLLGKTLGSYLGAGFAVRIGEEKIRLVFALVVLLSVGKLILT